MLLWILFVFKDTKDRSLAQASNIGYLSLGRKLSRQNDRNREEKGNIWEVYG